VVALGAGLVAWADLSAWLPFAWFLPVVAVGSIGFLATRSWSEWPHRLRSLATAVLADRLVTVAVLATAAAAGITFVVGVFGAPNTTDGMTYHLPRIMHWLQNRSVAHYATDIPRQLWPGPFAEYAIAAVVAPAGGSDRAAFLPQWLAHLGSIGLGAWIARLLGASTRGQAIAALFVATTPAAILEASSTQDDLVVSFWLLSLVALVLLERKARDRPASSFGWLGLTLGLLLLTKPSAVPFALPWLALLVPVWLERRRVGPIVARFGLAALGTMVVVLPHWRRNLVVFGNPIADPIVERMLRPVSLAPLVVASNAMTNLSLQLATPWHAVNQSIVAGIDHLHRLVGLDLGSLYPDWGGFTISRMSTNEALATNPLQVLLFVVAAVVVLRHWRRSTSSERGALAALLLGAIGSSLVARWQEFGGRFQLPGLLEAAPFTAAILISRGGRTWHRVLVGAAILVSLPYLFVNQTRRLLPYEFPLSGEVVPSPGVLGTSRLVQYFAGSETRRGPYRRAVASLVDAHCDRIGLKADYDSWEYPLWALARREDLRVSIYPVLVDAAQTRQMPNPDEARPICALVALDQPAEWAPRGRFATMRPRLRDRGITVWTWNGAGAMPAR
jgi:4-amino-4-deoxy-L-arabinose transferase-like glycosyltransferase